MEARRMVKQSFSVIGREGSTDDGAGFVARLWRDANARFAEIEHLAKRDESGALVGLWGAMTDFSRAFLPWEDDFSRGLYLAGVECQDYATPPEGWVKWTLPSFEYVVLPNGGPKDFPNAIAYLHENNLPLVGAAHDFINPNTGENLLFLPVKKL